MSAVVVDTHALVWMLVEPSKLSSAAQAAFKKAVDDGEMIYFSSISIVELCYLTEKGRLPKTVLDQLLAAMNRLDATLAVMPVTSEIAFALRDITRDSVPDMPDRIIAATAYESGLPLVTRDHRIRASIIHTIW